jgi:hypothetical protein
MESGVPDFQDSSDNWVPYHAAMEPLRKQIAATQSAAVAVSGIAITTSTATASASSTSTMTDPGAIEGIIRFMRSSGVPDLTKKVMEREAIKRAVDVIDPYVVAAWKCIENIFVAAWDACPHAFHWVVAKLPAIVEWLLRWFY